MLITGLTLNPDSRQANGSLDSGLSAGGNNSAEESIIVASSEDRIPIDDNPLSPSTSQIIPAFAGAGELTDIDLRARMSDAIQAWLLRSPSLQTRDCYTRDLRTFLKFAGIPELRNSNFFGLLPMIPHFELSVVSYA